MATDGDVRVSDDGRGNQNGAAWGEPDDETEFPEHEVTTVIGVEPAEGCDGTPAERQVLVIHMRPRGSVRPKVESGGAEDRLGEGAN